MFNVRDIAEFVVIMIEAFAQRYQLTLQEAESYLSRHGALEMMRRHYSIMHTLPYADNIESLSAYCNRKGGNIA